MDKPVNTVEYNIFDDVDLHDNFASSHTDVIAMAKSRHATAQYAAARHNASTSEKKHRNPFDYTSKSHMKRIESNIIKSEYMSLEKRSDNRIDTFDAAESTMECDSDTAIVQSNDSDEQNEWCDVEVDENGNLMDFVVSDNDISCEIDTVHQHKKSRKRLIRNNEWDQKPSILSHDYIDNKTDHSDSNTTRHNVTIRSKRRTH